MKFLCPSCKAKYQISDEKVAGRSVRMKCRRCGHMIQVSSEDAVGGSSVPPPNSEAAGVSEALPAASAVAHPPPAKPNPAPGPAPPAGAPPAPSAAKSRVPAPKPAASASLAAAKAAAAKPAVAAPVRAPAEKAADALRVPRAGATAKAPTAVPA